MNDTIYEIINFTIGLEGGYVNDPHDPGGETKYGISKRSHPDLDIVSLTRADAVDIYYTNYWVMAGYDNIDPLLAAQAFDHGVNRGIRNGVKLLQRTIGSGVDGILGPKTIAASEIDEIKIMGSLARMYKLRLNDYDSLRPDLVERYGKGWHNRAAKFYSFNLKLFASR